MLSKIGNVCRVHYRGTDNHIHELWMMDGVWHSADLFVHAGGGVAAAGDPAGYTSRDGHELWLNTGSMTLHNSLCRWYGNTQTKHYIQEATGKDCGICGCDHQTEAIQPVPSSSPS